MPPLPTNSVIERHGPRDDRPPGVPGTGRKNGQLAFGKLQRQCHEKARTFGMESTPSAAEERADRHGQKYRSCTGVSVGEHDGIRSRPAVGPCDVLRPCRARLRVPELWTVPRRQRRRVSLLRDDDGCRIPNRVANGRPGGSQATQRPAPQFSHPVFDPHGHRGFEPEPDGRLHSVRPLRPAGLKSPPCARFSLRSKSARSGI